jgi:hypothetical protein
MKYVRSYSSLNEGLSVKSKQKLEKLASKFIRDYVLNEFVNNSDGAQAFYSMIEDMHEKELGVSMEEVDDNYDEIENLVKDFAKKLVAHIS